MNQKWHFKISSIPCSTERKSWELLNADRIIIYSFNYHILAKAWLKKQVIFYLSSHKVRFKFVSRHRKHIRHRLVGLSHQVRLCHANAGVREEINLEIRCETKTKHLATRTMSGGDRWAHRGAAADYYSIGSLVWLRTESESDWDLQVSLMPGMKVSAHQVCVSVQEREFVSVCVPGVCSG